MKPLLCVAIAASLATLGCASPGTVPQRTRPTTKPTEVVTGVMPACVVSPRGQADRRCDPGVRNPDVTQATIHQTICVPGWSDKVRPSSSYTSKLRDVEMLTYYPVGTPTTAVREDHLIAQSLGGHLTDEDNLWPQPVAASYEKDQHTKRLRLLVCSGGMALDAAQREILDTWTWVP